MADPHVITALVKKRSELAGELLEAERRKQAIMASLVHVDSVLGLFGYQGEPSAIPARRKQSDRVFGRGELTRMIYDIGRERPELACNRDIAAEVMQRKDWDIENTGLVTMIASKVKDVRKRLKP